MELIEIKEILKKASVEVDIQGHGKNVALFETDFERVAIELGNKIKPLQEEVGRYKLIADNLFDQSKRIETLTKRVEELEELPNKLALKRFELQGFKTNRGGKGFRMGYETAMTVLDKLYKELLNK